MEESKKIKLVILTNPNDSFSGSLLSNIEPSIWGSIDVSIITIKRKPIGDNLIKKVKYFFKYVGIRKFVWYILDSFFTDNLTIDKIANIRKVKLIKSSIEDLKKALIKINPNIMVVASLSHILKENMIRIPIKGSFNVHPSFLPFHRGPNPLFWTLYHDEDYIGVSIHQLTEKIDSGKIIAQTKELIKDYDLRRLTIQAGYLAGNLLSNCILQIDKMDGFETKEKGSYEGKPTVKMMNELHRRLKKE